jgi:curved DNA-binding protein CbpA
MPNEIPERNVLYRRLEVAPGASRDEIVRAYRRLAHTAHPDAHPEDPDAARRFRDITEAYDVLIDPESRARYDRRRGAPRPIVVPNPSERRPCPEPRAEQPIPDTTRPLTLGLRRVPIREVPLRAGPVRIEPHVSDSAVPSSAGETPAAQMAALFSEIVEAWRRARGMA